MLIFGHFRKRIAIHSIEIVGGNVMNWTLGLKKDYFVCFQQLNMGYFAIN